MGCSYCPLERSLRRRASRHQNDIPYRIISSATKCVLAQSRRCSPLPDRGAYFGTQRNLVGPSRSSTAGHFARARIAKGDLLPMGEMGADVHGPAKLASTAMRQASVFGTVAKLTNPSARAINLCENPIRTDQIQTKYRQFTALPFVIKTTGLLLRSQGARGFQPFGVLTKFATAGFSSMGRLTRVVLSSRRTHRLAPDSSGALLLCAFACTHRAPTGAYNHRADFHELGASLVQANGRQ